VGSRGAAHASSALDVFRHRPYSVDVTSCVEHQLHDGSKFVQSKQLRLDVQLEELTKRMPEEQNSATTCA
jgi:hypothetical protein